MDKRAGMVGVVVAGTWTFSRGAVSTAAELMRDGKSAMDALERGINTVEDDLETGRFFVGRGSFRNAVGRHQFDAAVMRGADSSFGGVASLSGFARPFSVARVVLERSRHSMLVGDGAARFAEGHGFQRVSDEELDDEASACAWERFQKSGDTSAVQFLRPSDTLGVVVRDAAGRVTAGISTSGPAFKTDGRVGDSPLPGSGLYADDAAGACVASGDGDTAMRYCPTFDVVRRMRHGCSAGRACDEVVREMVERAGQRYDVLIH